MNSKHRCRVSMLKIEKKEIDVVFDMLKLKKDTLENQE